jgi:hypothetical protein
MLLALLLACLAATAEAHGSLVIPPPRQAIDRHATPWKGGYSQHCKNGSLACKLPNTQDDYPGTGRWPDKPGEGCGSIPWACQEACSCSNGTSACDVGQACYWFSSGCTIGCDECDGDGKRVANSCRCGKCANATNNNPLTRTANRDVVPGSAQDVNKYNPWRWPGKAPVLDACGMAGGGLRAGVESG